jgi:GMP synthase (glutamine-hydrolysing)
MGQAMNMKKIVLIKAGATFGNIAEKYGDYDEWIIKGLGCGREHVRIIDSRTCISLPDINECEGVVISGSRSHVTENLDWVNALAAWVPLIVNAGIPVLGICFGHQLLAYAFGGKVGFHPQGREIGTVGIELDEKARDDALFGRLPGSFSANVSHKQTVFELPEGAVRLAFNAHEQNHAFRLGGCAWGVQFHPEFSADAMSGMIGEQSGDLKAEGFDVETLLGNVKETPEAYALLGRFCELVQNKMHKNGSE